MDEQEIANPSTMWNKNTTKHPLLLDFENVLR